MRLRIDPNPALIAFMLAVWLLAPGCRSESAQDDLRICSASSLRHVLPQSMASVDSRAAERIRFDATSRLARQIAQGAPCTLFFAADPRWVDWLETQSPLTERRVMHDWSNRLVVLVRGGFDRPLASLEEVLQVDRLAMAHPEVPLGAATREALEKLSVAPDTPVYARSAAHVVQLVESGAVDAAIAFSSEIPFLRSARLGFELDARTYTPVRYVGVALNEASQSVLRGLSPGNLLSLSSAPAGEHSWMP